MSLNKSSSLSQDEESVKQSETAQPTLVDPHESLSAFTTYEEYLDSQVKEADIYYLEDEDLARQLVELGFRGDGRVLSREEFALQKGAELDRDQPKKDEPKPSASSGCDLTGSPLLQALASREDLVRTGKLSTIVFVRDKNNKGQEKKKKLMPKPSDLSYYNWYSQTSTSNSTDNFQVLVDPEHGLLFKNKRDRKVINVDPEEDPGDNTTRTEVKDDEYLQVVIYDHMTRRKA